MLRLRLLQFRGRNGRLCRLRRQLGDLFVKRGILLA